MQKYILDRAERVTMIMENDEIGHGFWNNRPAIYRY